MNKINIKDTSVQWKSKYGTIILITVKFSNGIYQNHLIRRWIETYFDKITNCHKQYMTNHFYEDQQLLWHVSLSWVMNLTKLQ